MGVKHRYLYKHKVSVHSLLCMCFVCLLVMAFYFSHMEIVLSVCQYN